MTVSDTKTFLLNLVELCVTVFRGPDADTWSKMADSGLPELLDRVQGIPGFPAAPVRGLAKALSDCRRTGGFSPLETEYVRLFIACPGGVPAPLYQSCHQDTQPRTMGQSALDMQSRLDEAGLEISLPSNEPPDHLTIELEYLFFLLSEEWFRDASRAGRGIDFASTVMLPWVRRFRNAVAAADPHPVFLHTADIAVVMLEALVKT
ncbi:MULTISPECIES: molecular chaperone TorD family protein [unclassified Pseudodesulfovibrio]|uniref:TorD/DmsD family molecular chaperone n=1 Tax=unclassified Pseudodesulfovibrio TaxID=2661612 RepID=UPI000FEBA713|nr:MULTISPECIES: molecular chaperone TorD family protein [unclassified Pseudodesulfovibrio]MCJ2165397.1 molecular chaperone TorD family protein [Pseudodesulfovibrio sp. S3-i]RWU03151.1 hypothetical protein DWB63_12195 [Pseudodesulfovibrio sp. S3]